MSKLTKWEVGQVLIDVSDKIGSAIDDLIDSKETEVAKTLTELMAKVGDLFDKNNDHAFGILNSESLKNKQQRMGK